MLLLGARVYCQWHMLAKATMQTRQGVVSHLPRDPHEFLPSYQPPLGHNRLRTRAPKRSWIETQSNASAIHTSVMAAVHSPKNRPYGEYEGRARDLRDGVRRSPGLSFQRGKEKKKTTAHHIDRPDELSHGVLDHIHDTRMRTPRSPKRLGVHHVVGRRGSRNTRTR